MFSQTLFTGHDDQNWPLIPSPYNFALSSNKNTCLMPKQSKRIKAETEIFKNETINTYLHILLFPAALFVTALNASGDFPGSSLPQGNSCQTTELPLSLG